MLPWEFGVDIFSEIERLMDEPYELILSSRAMKELEIIEMRMDVSKRGAKLGRAMLTHKLKEGKIRIIENDEKVDDWIVNFAKKHHAYVCTNDGGIRRRLRAEKVKIIALRGKSHLSIV